jgi:hypothetical protein
MSLSLANAPYNTVQYVFTGLTADSSLWLLVSAFFIYLKPANFLMDAKTVLYIYEEPCIPSLGVSSH